MDLIEYYCNTYDTTFTLISDKLYELNTDEDEWEPVNWDIIEEDDEINDHYSWVYSKLKSDIAKAIKNDPINSLFN